ncbi:MAG: hypothetical protein MUF49_28490 [Oculatellaceae cyanobacterium Prado106]|jgi:hypothetical protein|nr:hypothetical protein [Oculatellaceae cyanobacterium Prado106]
MQIRLIGSADQIDRLASLLPGQNRPRPSRKQANQKLLYLDIDDRSIERLLYQLEDGATVNFTNWTREDAE